MKLKVKNVGRIKKADIDINGITVICGDNNTGKSTFGKLLYCIYAALYNLPERIRRERLYSLFGSVARFSHRPYRLQEDGKVASIFNELIDDPDPTEEKIQKTLYDIFVLMNESDDDFIKALDESMVERIKRYLSVSDEDIVTVFLQRIIQAEFGGKLANVNSSLQKANVTLELKENKVSFHTSGKSQKLTLEQYINLEKRMIYIDDPFILDEVSRRPLYRRDISEHHRDAMIKLIQKTARSEQGNVIEEIIRDTILREVVDKMNEISDGSLVFEDGEFKYRHNGLKDNLSLVSVSTGIKTFTILRSLLEKGFLEENGIIFMDEPEVHLHPEWQIRLAEITVLLQKAYGLNIIITTHSIDFFTAIDFFSRKYEVREKCQFYLTEKENVSASGKLEKVVIKNFTKDMEKIYSSISEPYLKIYDQMEGD